MAQYLSIDVGGTQIKSALVNEQGQVTKKVKQPTPKNKRELLELFQQIIGIHANQVLGIGLSVPGKVDPVSGTIYHGGALPFLDQCPLKAILEEVSGLPVTIENDGKSAALAEHWLGELKGSRNGAVLLLGTGLGGGLILNDQLYRGSSDLAGELSFILMNEEVTGKGFAAGDKVSAVKMIQRIGQELQLPDHSDGQRVFQAIRAGNTAAGKIFSDFCYDLAVIINNLQAVLDVECFVIGGGISRQPLVTEEIKRQMILVQNKYYAHSLGKPRTLIKTARFANEANLIGAVYQLITQESSSNCMKSYG